MVSLKSFLHYFSPARPAQPLSEAENSKSRRLFRPLVAKRILRKWTPVLPVCGLAFAILRPWTRSITAAGRAGVIILGQQVHAIFGKQSDALRQLLDEHFAARK